MVNAQSLTLPLQPISDAPSGKMESVLPALNVGTSTLTKYAHPLATSALLGMMFQEPALPATMDTQSPTEPVPLMSTLQLFQKAICSAKLGLELLALNALIELSLIQKESAPQ